MVTMTFCGPNWLQQRLQLVLQLRISGGAIGRLQAARHDQIQGALSILRGFGADRLLRVSHAVQNHGVDVRGVAAHVQFRDARAVGAAVQIDLLEAQGRAHVVQIAHRDAGGIEAHLRPKLGEAVDRRLAQRRQRIRRLLPVLGIVARLLIGISRAALIQQHDGMIAVDAREGAAERHVHLHGALSRAAGQQKQRRRGAAPVRAPARRPLSGRSIRPCGCSRSIGTRKVPQRAAIEVKCSGCSSRHSIVGSIAASSAASGPRPPRAHAQAHPYERPEQLPHATSHCSDCMGFATHACSQLDRFAT